MKKIQYLFVTVVLGLALTSCGDSFLTQYPAGGTLLEEQYEKLPDNLQGSIMGIYSKLYEYGGDHDAFGLRAIDMYGDIQSGDMAMQKSSYGWFETYERGYFYAYARGYIWSFYYDIINLTNLGLMAVEGNTQEIISTMDNGEEPSETILLQGYYYGQLLAIRGWAYSNLLNFYCDPMDALGNDMDDEKAIPVYTVTEVKKGVLGAPLSTVGAVYDLIYEDLFQSVEVLDYYSQFITSNSKLEVNADVARLMLAYAMLNQGDKRGKIYNGDSENAYDVALKYAKSVIDNGHYPLLPEAELYTTGFADVSAKNWMWGQDVTVETTTALASFFGQVDIHTYSYAAAGDTKGIDSKLYNTIDSLGWDARVGWFNAGDVDFPYCPNRKFYSPNYKDITELTKVDGDWLCDNVFMRVELAYLIAAEAAYRNGDEATAKNYLKLLCDERVIPGKEAEYTTWLGSLAGNALKEAIIYNWRVEMWGEGYSLQVLRRIQKQRTLGTNHLDRGGKTLNIEDAEYITYQCEIPTSETRYNPYLATTQLTHDNN
ncbi:MAG: RagB/SusD family nutrient uptake outer membrane protein [Paludibacteraceae bacterium]|nr:RagB/SusD family nutrient uptake outer membrane protein [Paludibacteraceae bacterium]